MNYCPSTITHLVSRNICHVSRVPCPCVRCFKCVKTECVRSCGHSHIVSVPMLHMFGDWIGLSNEWKNTTQCSA